MPDPVIIVDYDPGWPAEFERLRARAARALEAYGPRIEHVGSTAVPGLAAKPIIDLIIQLEESAHLAPVIAKLAELGYRHEGDLGVAGREAFAVPAGETRHHLYVCAPGSAQLRDQSSFRDYLRAHPETRDDYAALKRELAAQHRNNRTAYTNGKAAFVVRVLALAAPSLP